MKKQDKQKAGVEKWMDWYWNLMALNKRWCHHSGTRGLSIQNPSATSSSSPSINVIQGFSHLHFVQLLTYIYIYVNNKAEKGFCGVVWSLLYKFTTQNAY